MPKSPEGNIMIIALGAKMAVTATDACKLLGIGRKTLWRLKSTGRITPTSYGTYPITELERHLQEEIQTR